MHFLDQLAKVSDLLTEIYSNLTAYPTPYIGSLDRADRCLQLFPKFNTTGTATLSFVGQNTYHNPCKVECALCENELPENNLNKIRSYPAHISLKDSIVQCTESVEVFEQYMEDGVKCGPYHVSVTWICLCWRSLYQSICCDQVCDDLCCVAHPELFPKAKARASTTPPPQTIQSDWTQPLSCEEDGFFRNPNDCHKFYRCHEVKGQFVKTLFNCNPSNAVFDEQFRVCVPPEDTDACDDIYVRNWTIVSSNHQFLPKFQN